MSPKASSGKKHRQGTNKQKKSSPHGSNKKAKTTSNQNPLLDSQSDFLQSIPSSVKDNFFSSDHITPETRSEIWAEQAELGEKLVNKYAWATPDQRALAIIKHFSPIVEIGSGKNAYWANLMKTNDIDVICYDADPGSGGTIHPQEDRKKPAEKKNTKGQQPQSNTQKGGPEILSTAALDSPDRNLFLCYPDEDSDLGVSCLEHFSGSHVIHVGELYGDTLSMDQAPWGRSSSCDFQERLAGEYHCLLKASLTNWIHVKDTISVWKRSERCTMVFEEGDDEEEGEEVDYKHIPTDERLPVDVAAPCLSHLLDPAAN